MRGEVLSSIRALSGHQTRPKTRLPWELQQQLTEPDTELRIWTIYILNYFARYSLEPLVITRP